MFSIGIQHLLYIQIFCYEENLYYILKFLFLPIKTVTCVIQDNIGSCMSLKRLENRNRFALA